MKGGSSKEGIIVSVSNGQEWRAMRETLASSARICWTPKYPSFLARGA